STCPCSRWPWTIRRRKRPPCPPERKRRDGQYGSSSSWATYLRWPRFAGLSARSRRPWRGNRRKKKSAPSARPADTMSGEPVSALVRMKDSERGAVVRPDAWDAAADENLVRALRERRPEGSTLLYDRYARRVERVLLRVLGADPEL